MFQRWLRTLAPLFVIACGSSTPTPEPQRPTKADMAPAMEEHFEDITKIQKSVIRGELALAQSQAQTLAASLKNKDHPYGWEPHLHSVRGAVWRVVRAEDLETAAAATAMAAHTCGTCHEALGITVARADVEPPSSRPHNMSDYMAKHLWAADQMWAGLVGPSDEAWVAGAKVLAEAGLLPKSDVALDDRMVELAAKLNQVGRRAGEATADERAETYGEFLSACAGCHRAYLDKVD